MGVQLISLFWKKINGQTISETKTTETVDTKCLKNGVKQWLLTLAVTVALHFLNISYRFKKIYIYKWGCETNKEREKQLKGQEV